MKEWVFSHDDTEQAMRLSKPNDASMTTEKVLGVVWNPSHDEFEYKVQLRSAAKRKGKTRNRSDAGDQEQMRSQGTNSPTKRIILSPKA